MNDLALSVKDLNISFDLKKGHTLGIVGESGSGKSQSVLSLIGLLANNAIVSGQAMFKGQNLLELPTKELNNIRGSKISMIFQDPMTSLNPYLTIQKQLLEPLLIHQNMSVKEANDRVLKILDAVRIPDAKNRLKLYPHEFSGGMRQRIVIAMALLCNPEILIADEPTTALDVTVQAQILKLLADLQSDFNMSMLFITHDLGVVAEICHDVIVMYGGSVMESNVVDDIFYKPTHPYTKGLLGAMPNIFQERDTLMAIPGEAPIIQNMPKGCPFGARCDSSTEICMTTKPNLVLDGAHQLACHHPLREGK